MRIPDKAGRQGGGNEWSGRINEFKDRTTPFILTDAGILRQQCQLFRNLFPGVDLYYAVKAYPHGTVLQILDPLIDGYDAASIFEIKQLLHLGVDPKRISFNNPVKSPDAIRVAGDWGVMRFAAQSEEELAKVARHAKGAEVFIRVRMGDAKGAQSFSSKFGCPPERAIDLLLLAEELGLVSEGITFHIGSQATDLSAWRQAVKKAQNIVLHARRQGLDVPVINMGGGLPVRYRQEDVDIHDVANVVMATIAQGPQHIKYIAEPGRFLTADSSVIVATVIGREYRDGTSWLFLDVGVFQAFTEVFEFGKFHHPVYSLRHLDDAKGAEKTKYTLTGPTCDSFDTMAESVFLPADLREGDRLLIDKAGAYTIAYGSNFNGFPVPRTVFFNAMSEKE